MKTKIAILGLAAMLTSFAPTAFAALTQIEAYGQSSSSVAAAYNEAHASAVAQCDDFGGTLYNVQIVDSGIFFGDYWVALSGLCRT